VVTAPLLSEDVLHRELGAKRFSNVAISGLAKRRAGVAENEVVGKTIGPVREALDIFSPLMRRWFELESCPPVQRLAFGAILRQPVNDQQSGYRQISAYLPFVKLDAENSSDFSYQINRPRVSTSGFAELKINRLSKWSVVAGQSIQFAVGLTSARYLPGRAYFACHLEVDINTAAEFQGELPRDQLPQIFQELVDLGIEIAREGDIP